MKTKLIPKSFNSNNGSFSSYARLVLKRRAIFTVFMVVGFTCISVQLLQIPDSRMLLSFRNGMLNAIKVKEWRHNVISRCKSAVSDKEMLDVRKISRHFTSTVHENESLRNLDLKPEYWIQRCPFVFLDLGSGAGDTIGEFIDTGLEGCRRSDDDTLGFDPMHFDVDSGKFQEVPGTRKGERNEAFTTWVKGSIDKFYHGLGPEDYCVFGVEPNPLLKDNLTKLERHVNRMHPRPLRHLHFLTELAIHSEDDTKKTIFVDSLRNGENYPGSSLFQNHKNVRESVSKFKDTFKYEVDTMTLSTLIKQTSSYFREAEVQGNADNSTNLTEFEESLKNMESLSRQHLIIYFDIEGSEFHVLNEAVDSGVLCEFAQDNSNIIDIFIEYHSPQVMSALSKSAQRFIEEVRPLLLSEKCGGDNLTLREHMKFF